MEQSASPQPVEPRSPQSRRRRRRAVVIAIPALVIALVVGGAWWFGVRDGGGTGVTTTTSEELVTVTRGPLTDTVSAEGTVAAADSADLRFGASGTVTAVTVGAGDQVVAGQVLATIDSAALEAEVEEARSDLADAEATLADDRASGASSTQVAVDEARIRTAQDTVTDAEEALAGATLTAEFDGTVASVNVSVGERLGTGVAPRARP
jgi:multidrug efflux pump subunit AcrA (membrane-fusion protein)